MESILNIKENELNQLRKNKDELNRIADELKRINVKLKPSIIIILLLIIILFELTSFICLSVIFMLSYGFIFSFFLNDLIQKKF